MTGSRAELSSNTEAASATSWHNTSAQRRVSGSCPNARESTTTPSEPTVPSQPICAKRSPLTSCKYLGIKICPSSIAKNSKKINTICHIKAGEKISARACGRAPAAGSAGRSLMRPITMLERMKNTPAIRYTARKPSCSPSQPPIAGDMTRPMAAPLVMNASVPLRLRPADSAAT